MADEASKFSISNPDDEPSEKLEKSDFAAYLPESPESIKKISISTKKSSRSVHKIREPIVILPVQNKESRIVRFLNKINHFFVEILGGPSVARMEVNLTGRIHRFQKDVDKALKQLNALRMELESDDLLQFPSLIPSVIDPLIKELNRLEKNKDLQITVAQQVKESKEYVEWIEKANKWIGLCTKRHIQRDALHKAFIDHTFHEFRASVDKDLKVIQDYLNFFLDQLDENDLVKVELKDQLEEELSQHIFELYLLKDHPPSYSLEALNEWRAEADQARESYFSAALHVIDTNIGELMQPTIFEDNLPEQHIVDIHTRLNLLEEKIINFSGEINKFENDKSELRKNECLFNLAKMEDEAHSLNSNLQLTHEHIARVSEAMKALSSFRKKLQ